MTDSSKAIRTGWILIITAIILFTAGSFLIIKSYGQSDVPNISIPSVTPVANTFNVSLKVLYSGTGLSFIIIGSIPLITGILIIFLSKRKISPVQY